METNFYGKYHNKQKDIYQYPLKSLSSKQNFDLLQLQQQNPERYPFLLQSIATDNYKNTQTDSFDLLLCFPQQTTDCSKPCNFDDFYKNASQHLVENYIKPDLSCNESDLPFIGGWFCYFGYEYAQTIESSLNLPETNLPLARLVRIPAAIIYSHRKKQYYFIVETKFKEYYQIIQQDIVDLNQDTIKNKPNSLKIIQQWQDSKYLNSVAKIKKYILDGDVFQVNLSHEWQIEMENNNSFSVYDSLRKHNPAPFACHILFNDFKIISSSPERLVRRKNEWVETRPIAGTRKRGATQAEDERLVKQLLEHPKERAEHIMLIDLERNDLGRICQTGTIEVNEFMQIETYQHVHHIVSNIRGKIDPSLYTNALDIIHAVFPGGTITGCPKIRCMEIISQLEQKSRGIYTGTVGYINRDGSLDTNILIRSFSMIDNKITLKAGAGIVSDSIADKELAESRQKALGLLKSLHN